MQINTGGQEFNCEIIKSSRRTIELRLVSKNNIVIRAPKRLSNKDIQSFIYSKSDWILEKNTNLKEAPMATVYEDGEEVMYLGSKYTLRVKRILGNRSYTSIQDDVIEVKTNEIDSESIKKILEKLYREKLKMIVTKYVKDYTKLLGVQCNRILIKDQKTRWGSCSSKQNLNFNYRLVLAPKEVIEYVVLHEVCHLIHLDHSENFWNLVRDYMPEYKQHKEWLRVNGGSLKL